MMTDDEIVAELSQLNVVLGAHNVTELADATRMLPRQTTSSVLGIVARCRVRRRSNAVSQLRAEYSASG